MAQLRVGARAHLAGGLVGEGHGEDAVRRHAQHLIEPGDAVGQDPGLAGAGAGQHQIVSRRRGHRLTLGRVEIVEQVGDIHPGILPARAQAMLRRSETASPIPGRRRCASGSTVLTDSV